MLSLMVDLKGKQCVVMGAGSIALRKIKELLKEKAIVTVISPSACQEIVELYTNNKITYIQRKAAIGDGSGAFLVVIATNDFTENQELARHLRSTTLVNVASDAVAGNFHIPSTYKKGKLQLSVSTNGASPKLAKKIKEEWQSQFDDSYIEYVDFLYQVRSIVKQFNMSVTEKNAILEEILDNQYRESANTREIYYEELLKKLT